MLYLFGKSELNLAIEKLHSGMTETHFRGLFSDLELACDRGCQPLRRSALSRRARRPQRLPARAFTI